MSTPENPGFWRADNVATSAQIQTISEQLITPEYMLAPEPLVYRLPAGPKYPFRTLAIISNFVPWQRRDPLSLMSAAIQEQTHLTPNQALTQHQPFHGRRTVFEIGLEIEDGSEGKIPADDLYLKLARYEITTLRELEEEAGNRLLAYKHHEEDTAPDAAELEEKKVAAAAACESFRRRAASLRARAPYSVATFDDAQTLLTALSVCGRAPLGRT